MGTTYRTHVIGEIRHFRLKYAIFKPAVMHFRSNNSYKNNLLASFSAVSTAIIIAPL